MSRRSLRFSPRAGLTLLEVIAGIAILSTILVSAVVSRSRHARQLAMSERVEVALAAADELIADWWTDSAGLPVGRSGQVQAVENMIWQVAEVPNLQAQQLGCRVVRVQLLQEGSIGGIEDGQVLAEVELMLPAERPEPEQPQPERTP
ncbi:MAG: type II secretion system protein [Phycisphaerae bacterium]